MQPTPLKTEKDPEDSDKRALLVGNLLQLAQKAGESGYSDFSDDVFYLAMRWSQCQSWQTKPQSDSKLTKDHIRTLLQ